jgi:hypothetical protein
MYVALLVGGPSLSLAGAWAGRGERKATQAGSADATLRCRASG